MTEQNDDRSLQGHDPKFGVLLARILQKLQKTEDGRDILQKMDLKILPEYKNLNLIHGDLKNRCAFIARNSHEHNPMIHAYIEKIMEVMKVYHKAATEEVKPILENVRAIFRMQETEYHGNQKADSEDRKDAEIVYSRVHDTASEDKPQGASVETDDHADSVRLDNETKRELDAQICRGFHLELNQIESRITEQGEYICKHEWGENHVNNFTVKVEPRDEQYHLMIDAWTNNVRRDGYLKENDFETMEDLLKTLHEVMLFLKTWKYNDSGAKEDESEAKTKSEDNSETEAKSEPEPTQKPEQTSVQPKITRKKPPRITDADKKSLDDIFCQKVGIDQDEIESKINTFGAYQCIYQFMVPKNKHNQILVHVSSSMGSYRLDIECKSNAVSPRQDSTLEDYDSFQELLEDFPKQIGNVYLYVHDLLRSREGHKDGVVVTPNKYVRQ